MFERQKKKSLDQFLNKVSDAYDTDIDPDGKCKEAALVYLKEHHYDAESFEDLSEAFDELSKNAERLLTVQGDLVKQGEDPTSITWLNDEQTQNTLCEHGVLELLIQRKK